MKFMILFSLLQCGNGFLSAKQSTDKIKSKHNVIILFIENISDVLLELDEKKKPHNNLFSNLINPKNDTVKYEYTDNASSTKNFSDLVVLNTTKIRKSATYRRLLTNFNNLKSNSVSFQNLYGEISSTSLFAALFTGRPAVDTGMIRGKLLPFDGFPNVASSGGLPDREATLAKALKACGYLSWFVGYWKMGLGPRGDRYPTIYGFDTWMGIVHPHNRKCSNGEFNNNNNVSNKQTQYSSVIYRYSIILIVILVPVVLLIWSQLTSIIHINVLMYSLLAALIFYLFMQLFKLQIRASCALYYDGSIYQQPYDANNLTVHFTHHSLKLIRESSRENKPFFMVLNYLKMKRPYSHSTYLKQTDSQTLDAKESTMKELDWSLGVLLKLLKSLGVYDKTIIVLTGSRDCDVEGLSNFVYGFQRNSDHDKLHKKKLRNWQRCLKVPLWIKDITKFHRDDSSKDLTFDVRKTSSITSLYSAILQRCDCTGNKTVSARRSLFKNPHEDTCHFTTWQHVFLANTSRFDMNKETCQHEQQWSSNEKDSDVIFHYYDIQKPVMVTYKQRYQVIYYELEDSNKLKEIDEPLLIDLKGELTNKDQELFEDILRNVTAALEHHMTLRQTINMWTSQFEMPVYPWLFPCANFPRCVTDKNR